MNKPWEVERKTVTITYRLNGEVKQEVVPASELIKWMGILAGSGATAIVVREE